MCGSGCNEHCIFSKLENLSDYLYLCSLVYNKIELKIACWLNSILFTPNIIGLNLLKFTMLILKFSKKKKLVTMELVLHLWFSESVHSCGCARIQW
jgi:hypothetical protein